MEKKNKLIVILGPTAVGKTKLAVKLASVFNGEIVSADSRQVYRGMDIGTGKDLREYELKRKPHPNPPLKGEGNKIKIPYHLIDIVSPNTNFSLAKYQKLAYKAIDDIIKRGKTPLLVGGTGLYIQSVVDGMPLLAAKPNWKLRDILGKWDTEKLFKELKKLDPKLGNEAMQNNKRRMIRYIEIMRQCKKPITQLWREQKRAGKYDCLLLGVLPKPHPNPLLKGEGITIPPLFSCPLSWREDGGKLRLLLNTKIDQRIDTRLEKEGMVEEVERLHKKAVSWKRLEQFGLEYKFIAKYLQGELTYNEMVNLLKIASHQFAKRQMTWFKRDERIKWVNSYGEAKKLVNTFFKNNITKNPPSPL